MPKKKAGALTIEIWTYLAEHPEITRMRDLPEYLWKKVEKVKNHFPLCAVFTTDLCGICPGCPLDGQEFFCCSDGQPYDRWTYTGNAEKRSKAAWEIVNKVKAQGEGNGN
jgi:hypothetical protein